MSADKYTFWFDLENAPNVPFFQPIAQRLRSEGHVVYLTGRDYADIPALAERFGIPCTVIGHHGGANKVHKIIAGLSRSSRLGLWAWRRRIDLAAGYGSRTLAVACGMMRIPNVTAFDYEHVAVGVFGRFCDAVYVADAVDPDYIVSRGVPRATLRSYPGLKEEVYAAGYRPREDLVAKLGIDTRKVIVVMRPPATLAHYHEAHSEAICREILARVARDPSIHVVFVRRAGDGLFDEFLRHDNIRPLPEPVRGLDLIHAADLVLSGGGTMIREAVAMGVPAYSFFTGRPGAVDEKLSREGRLTLVRRQEDIGKIRFAKSERTAWEPHNASAVLDFFVDEFLCLAARSRAKNADFRVGR